MSRSDLEHGERTQWVWLMAVRHSARMGRTRILLDPFTYAWVHARPRRCHVPGCLAARNPLPDMLDLCEVHQSAIWVRELVELWDKTGDDDCTMDDFNSYLLLAVEIAKVRAAAAKLN